MSSILKFFKPITNNIDKKLDKSTEESPPTKRQRTDISQPVESRNIFPNDIANFSHKQLNDFEKYEVIEHYWVPDINFKFPTSGKRNLKFQHSWLRSFAWLVYSAAEDGAYCRYCVSFGSNFVGKGGHQSSNMLVQRMEESARKIQRTPNKKISS
ncbi:uncharacterized protein LOC126904925 [Daktulosphaira vitifoliae]|uniref:uncharacterized protein LOC126904925 n=1 Tax=Daktulosphaira vitifoliae TaxID=58002 RepID=UPI0021AA0BC5|nr:uncharacterized protein LOC126904925 [Daktulosphaira vitifoliae]